MGFDLEDDEVRAIGEGTQSMRRMEGLLQTHRAVTQASLISSNARFRLISPSLAGSLHEGHRLVTGRASRIHCWLIISWAM